MKINHNFAAVCIVLGVVFLGISMQFDHIIGGNAVRGYHKEEVYMVYNKENTAYTQVSKSVWYINYVYTQIDMFFLYLGCVSAAYLFLEYILLPLLKKLMELDRRYGRE